MDSNTVFVIAVTLKFICSVCFLIAAYNLESYRGWLVAAAIMIALFVRISTEHKDDVATCPKCGYSFKVEE